MKKILIAIILVAAILFAWGIYALPERLDNFPLIQLSKSHDLLGYDLVSDRYGMKDSRGIEDIVQVLKAANWSNRRDEDGTVKMTQQVYKWPMRYDYSVRISRGEIATSDNLEKMGAAKPSDFIELWYVIDGSLQWFHKVQPDT